MFITKRPVSLSQANNAPSSSGLGDDESVIEQLVGQLQEASKSFPQGFKLNPITFEKVTGGIGGLVWHACIQLVTSAWEAVTRHPTAHPKMHAAICRSPGSVWQVETRLPGASFASKQHAHQPSRLRLDRSLALPLDRLDLEAHLKHQPPLTSPPPTHTLLPCPPPSALG